MPIARNLSFFIGSAPRSVGPDFGPPSLGACALALCARTDVVIIGSGIAGLNAALHFAKKGLHVKVFTKQTLQQSNTWKAQGGIAAVLSREDSIKNHVHDTLVAGCFHNNRKAVEFMVGRSTTAITQLMELGIPFERAQGKLRLTREAAHSHARIAHVGDYTGLAIMQRLIAAVKKNSLISVEEHVYAAQLLVHRNECFGVRVIKNKAFEHRYGKLTVLAAGGPGQLYARTTNPRIATSDGIALGVRAGCTVKDLEFIQFHPTALAIPGKPCFLISEAVRGEGGILLNSCGKRFMKRYHPQGELAPRDIVARAIAEELKSGAVFLSVRHLPARAIRKRFPKIYETLMRFSLDMTRRDVPVSPAAHYSCGGITTNLKTETNVHRLLAVGEVACTGVHGANRLASNSLLEAVVFSTEAAQNRMKPLRTMHFRLPHYRDLTKSEMLKAQAVRRKLQKIMWNNVGVIRTNHGLMQAKKEVHRLAAEIKNIPRAAERIIEVDNMMTVALMIIAAAQKRKQSLGCHYRIS